MSSLHMFLPVCEPARSEALAQLIRTHHVPRHLVKGIAIRHRSACGPAAPVDAPQQPSLQQAQESQAPAAAPE
ncbi:MULTISPECIES: hypothetical protein [unclassified Variovorax]|uniref:hypothetical protein n=1 Tax=unclassified Variovorax TaxID=663243 RepID=UPI003F46C1EA